MTDGGQAAVEVALVLPVVVLVAVGLLQVAVVLRDQLAVDLAAREGARAAAVSAAPAAAADGAAARALTAGHSVEVAVGDETVTVTVRAAVTPVPLLGVIVAGREVVGRATMALEPP